MWVQCTLQPLVTPAALRAEGVVRIEQFFFYVQCQPSLPRTAGGRHVRTLGSPESFEGRGGGQPIKGESLHLQCVQCTLDSTRGRLSGQGRLLLGSAWPVLL